MHFDQDTPTLSADAPPPRPSGLPSARLTQRCDPGAFTFKTTADLPAPGQVVGQARAVESLEFGIGIRREGYNLFAFGSPGAGRHSVVRSFLERQAAREPQSPDWCYVSDFDHPARPKALRLPPGYGRRLRDDMSRLLEDIRAAIAAALDGDEYRKGREEAEEQFEQRHDKAFAELQEIGLSSGIAVALAPAGVILTPLQKGQPLTAEAFAALPEAEQARLREAMTGIEERFEKIARQLPAWRKETLHQIRELRRQLTSRAVDLLMEDIKREYAGFEAVLTYLNAVQQDVIENAEQFRQSREAEEPAIDTRRWARRYQVNVLTDRPASAGAPVVWEDNPTHQNLLGRIEHESQLGVLVTDFTHIRAGALHRANDGYLIIDAARVLTEPFAWQGLKRALRAREIRTESLASAIGLVTTVSLEPEPIPLNVKVVLVGDRMLYYLLYHFDPDFPELFKVGVDFADSAPRRLTSQQGFAELLGDLARYHKVRPLEPSAVARVIDHAARVAGDAERLSLNLRGLAELLCEADYWATAAGRSALNADDVQRAIDAQRRRADSLHERLLEEIQRGTISIATSGFIVGQVNGVSVAVLGGFMFGHPSRITARIRLGGGSVIDIEREVELGGPVHSKGVMILSGYLSGRFVTDQPLSLSASLVFEQNYGPVEGDSASAAELYALLSALADVPVRQGIAVTGSVDQHGNIQAVGGVNEKIEGFFDVCRERGLTGAEGVVIPAANVQHLMLRQDVIEAVEAGRFHVYAIGTIDEGLPILTDMEAGARGADGMFPPGSVNDRVEQRLAEFARLLSAFGAGPGETISLLEKDKGLIRP